MRKKNNTALTIGAIVAGVIFLPALLAKEGEKSPLGLNIFGAEMPEFPDLSGLFSGLGGQQSSVDIPSFLAGLGGTWFAGGAAENSGKQGGGFGFDLSAFLANLGIGVQGQGGATPDGQGSAPDGGSRTPANMPNTIPNIINSLGYSGNQLTNAALKGAGAYLGFKVLQPVAPVAGKALATGVRTVAAPVTRVAGSLATNVARVLTSPVSKVPVLGTIGAVAAAGGAGYLAGSALMKYTPLGEITTKWSGERGAKMGEKESGLGQFLFPKALVKMDLAPSTISNFERKYGITMQQAKGMSTADLQAVLRGAN